MKTQLNRYPGLTRFITCLVLIAFATGCTTMRPVDGTDAASFAGQFEVGDKVRITRMDFSTHEFEITEIADDGIGGDGIFIPWSDIQLAEIRRIDRLRTGTVVVLGAAVVLAGVVLASGFDIGPIALAGPAP